jgi:hypothetical protein
MKTLLFLVILSLSSHFSFGQAYIPMPADSATWRYRIYDEDYLVQVIDFILFFNGRDTLANGNSYHQVFSRTALQMGPIGFNPPIVALDATSSDIYYGAIRESDKKVYLLAGAGEQLIFDFTVSVGDSIPAYGTKDKVVAIDSILLSDGLFHRRYLTTDPLYFAIEGVGSSLGLIPSLNDGRSDVTFICLTDSLVSYSPDTSIPCTYIYPPGYSAATANITGTIAEVRVFPQPATDRLDIASTVAGPLDIVIMNDLGQIFTNTTMQEKAEISVSQWARGIYYMQVTGGRYGCVTKKIVLQ